MAWFEWGTTTAYGNTTSPTDIGEGYTTIGVARTLFNLQPGTVYHYRLVAQNEFGTTEGLDRWFVTSTSTDVDDGAALPRECILHQNYPNPFNPETTIDFDLPNDMHVLLQVFDMLGREVSTLTDGMMREGRHTVRFQGDNLGSGIYVCRMKAGGITQSTRMTLVR